MTIKARPFKTEVGEAEVEGFFEQSNFVFRFYGVAFHVPVISIEEDSKGTFAALEETEIFHPDGFVFAVTTEYDSDLGCEWGYQVSLKRNEATERELFENVLKLKGIDPNSVNLIIPPRQLIAVFFNPDGIQDGSAQLGPEEELSRGKDPLDPFIIDRVRVSAAKRALSFSRRSANVAAGSNDNNERSSRRFDYRNCYRGLSKRSSRGQLSNSGTRR
jgi:hypothetical protein